MSLHPHDGPVAGPSSRPWVSNPRQAEKGTGRVSIDTTETRGDGLRRRKARPSKRQEVASSPMPESSIAPSPSATIPLDQPVESSAPSSAFADPTSASISSFDVPSSSYSPSASASASESPTRAPLFSGTRSETVYVPSSSSSTWSDSSARYTPSSLPWSTRTRHTSAAAVPTYIPGVEFDLTLGGDSDTEAVYAVAVELGHSMPATSRKRAPGDETSQMMNIQIDLGSSDMVSTSLPAETSNRLTYLVASIRIMYLGLVLSIQNAV
jgi:hypothetical protein